MKRNQAVVITVLFLLAIGLALAVTGRFWFRADLTAGKRYTIAPASRTLGQEIPDQVRLTYFVSEKLSRIYPMPGEIEDLLREYAAYSRGKIKVAVRDPVKDNVNVDSLGIQMRQMRTVDKDQEAVVQVYSGILIEYLDKSEAIPFVFALDTLEYDLTSRIRALVRDAPREIGVIVGGPAKSWSADYTALNGTLASAGLRVREIAPGDEIPEGLSALFVLGGAETIDDWGLYRIDRFIQTGGKALFALDSVVVDMSQGVSAWPVEDLGLLEMAAGYGAQVQANLVLDQSCNTVQIQQQAGPNMFMTRLERYPFWTVLLDVNGSPGHPLTANFAGLDLFWPSEVALNPPDAGIEAVPLFSSTADAWLETGNFAVDPTMAYQFTAQRDTTLGQKVLGAALSGTFPSAFRGKAKPVREGSEAELPDMPAQGSPARIIVVGNSAFASDLVQAVRGGGRNLEFLVQCADWLGNDEDIISIRSRASGTGRLDRITDPEKKSKAFNAARIINVAAVPVLVIVAGALAAVARKRRNREE
ncbi:MAG: GldG family protein [Treponema sp.]|jgi:ABC-type uncharacterized transport system involved in gliding motility auxiliary subunit|nr:GldG family protein [Treponema sp.]